MQYLTGEEILVIHARLVDATGGSHGVREHNLFASIIEKPKMAFGGKELSPTVFDKAAVYFESIARFHVFIDGNKRTSITAAARFLFLNKYELKAINKEVEDYVLEVAVGNHRLEQIAAWLKKHSKISK